MAHQHLIENADGDVIDTVIFCSDTCHRQWCIDNNTSYGGWNGCVEIQFGQQCETCEEIVDGIEPFYE